MTNDQTGLVTVAEAKVANKPGEWEPARRWLGMAKSFEMLKLFSQVMLGMELIRLHKQHGIKPGNPQFSQNGIIGKVPWNDLVKKETGLEHSTAHRFMQFAQQAAPRLKKIALLKDFDPAERSIAELPIPKVAALEKAVRKMTDGLTQKEFGEQLGLWKKPQGSGATGGKGGRTKLTMSEEAALRIETAQGDGRHCLELLEAYADWRLLSDEEITGQNAALEAHLNARKTWLKTPVADRAELAKDKKKAAK